MKDLNYPRRRDDGIALLKLQFHWTRSLRESRLGVAVDVSMLRGLPWIEKVESVEPLLGDVLGALVKRRTLYYRHWADVAQ